MTACAWLACRTDPNDAVSNFGPCALRLYCAVPLDVRKNPNLEVTPVRAPRSGLSRLAAGSRDSSLAARSSYVGRQTHRKFSASYWLIPIDAVLVLDC